MKKFLLTLLSVLTLTLPSLAATTFEYTFEGVKLYYEVTSEDPKEVKVVKDDSYESLTSVTIPSTVTNSDDVEYTVTAIGFNAFSDCDNFAFITIPNSVTSIGDDAFSDCSKLTSISIPESVTSIGDRAFNGCSALTSISIPKSVNSIDICAFEGCSNLREVNFEGTSTLTAISENTFSNCTNLTQINLPSSLKKIGKEAFSNCKALTSITIPSSVSSIAFNAFQGCAFLSTVICLGQEPPTIGINVFNGTKASSSSGDKLLFFVPDVEKYQTASSWTQPNIGLSAGQYEFRSSIVEDDYLKYQMEAPGSVAVVGIKHGVTVTDLVIPSTVTKNSTTYSVTSIGEGAFDSCTTLTSVTIPSSVTSIGKYAFERCSALTIVTIPASVTELGAHAFYACTSLNKVSFEEGSKLETIPSYAFDACSNLRDINIPSSVTTIDEGAFYRCSALTSITIPASVTNIAQDAFNGCSSLTYVKVDSNNSNYSSESGLLFNKDKSTLIKCPEGMSYTVTVLSSLTSIAQDAFANCNKLPAIVCYATTPPTMGSNENLKEKQTPIYVHASAYDAYKSAWIGYNLQKIGVIHDDEITVGNLKFKKIAGSSPVSVEVIGLVDGSSSVSEITIPKIVYVQESHVVMGYYVTAIGSEAFQYCSSLTSVTIPSSVTSIGNYAFCGCSSLTSIDIPEGVTAIGDNAFYNCSELTSVSIPSSVTSIGNNAFYYCSGLTSISIPDGVTAIGEMAFYNCSGLTSVSIPSSVTSIRNYAFSGCSSLTSVTIPSSVTSIGNYAFNLCSNLTKVDFDGPSTLTAISDNTFQECKKLEEINLPSSVTKIGVEAFQNCNALSSIELPSHLNTIEAEAFRNCSGLTSITIPESVSSIEKEAFIGCTNLTEVTCLRKSPAILGDKAFDISSDNSEVNLALEIYVPGGTLNAYKTSASWVDYRDNLRVAITGISLDMPSKTLKVGERFTLTATLTPSDATDAVIWSSGNEDVATVVADASDRLKGVVTAKSVGSAVITVTCGDFSATCTVTVIVPVECITLGASEATVEVGNTLALTATITPDNATDKSVTWTSNDESIATVDENGNVTPHKIGNVTITATSEENAITASCQIEVYLMGDADGDSNVLVADVVHVANYIVGNVVDNPAEDAPSNTVIAIENNSVKTFMKSAADMNGNGSITVTDAWLIAEKASTWGLGTSAPAPAANRIANYSNTDKLLVTDTGNELSLSLSGGGYTAFQADIILPDGVEMAEAVLSTGASAGHTLMTASKGNVYRVMVFSMANEELSASLPVVELKLKGDSCDDLDVVNAVASDAKANSVSFDVEISTSTTGVSAIGDSNIIIKPIQAGVTISGAEGQQIYIFTPDGKLLKTLKATSPTEQISLAPGLYLVRVTDKAQSVIVR